MAEFIQGFGRFKIPDRDTPVDSHPAESSHGATALTQPFFRQEILTDSLADGPNCFHHGSLGPVVSGDAKFGALSGGIQFGVLSGGIHPLGQTVASVQYTP